MSRSAKALHSARLIVQWTRDGRTPYLKRASCRVSTRLLSQRFECPFIEKHRSGLQSFHSTLKRIALSYASAQGGRSGSTAMARQHSKYHKHSFNHHRRQSTIIGDCWNKALAPACLWTTDRCHADNIGSSASVVALATEFFLGGRTLQGVLVVTLSYLDDDGSMSNRHCL